MILNSQGSYFIKQNRSIENKMPNRSEYRSISSYLSKNQIILLSHNLIIFFILITKKILEIDKNDLKSIRNLVSRPFSTKHPEQKSLAAFQTSSTRLISCGNNIHN